MWDYLKCKIRHFSKTFSKESAHSKKIEFLSLKTKLKILESKIRYREDPKYVEFPKYPKLMALSLEAGATGINIPKNCQSFS